MIRVVKGDLFESSAQTLVNTVNTVGVMGKGIALGFKKRFPEMFDDYVARCDADEVKLGEPYLYRTLFPPWIINFPTKEHWRGRSRLEAIVQGLDFMRAHLEEWEVTSLAVPPLGCGEGQLDWAVVGPTLYRKLDDLGIEVELYAPYDVPDEQLEAEFLAADTESVPVGGAPIRVPAAMVALAVILRYVERERYRWPIGRITFQKLAYFATTAGVPTGLDFERGSYGPFAAELKRLQTTMINNGLMIEERRGQMFEVRTGPTYEDAVRRHRAQLEEWRPAIERVADLLLRAERRQPEILASALYAAEQLHQRANHKHLPSPTEREVVDEVLRWKVRRKPPIHERDIAEATRTLNVLGWANLTPSDDLDRDPDFADLVG